MAFGPLQLKPSEFWRLTLAEFNDLVKGYQWREEQEWQRLAQLAAWTISPHLKKPVTADKLLGKQPDKKKIPAEEKRRELDELERRLGF